MKNSKMTGFLLKKYFYDLWDNIFIILTLNLGFLLFLSLTIILPPLLPPIFHFMGLVVFFILIFFLFVYLCAAASVLKEISDYRRPNLTAFLANLRGAIIPGIVLFGISALVFFIIRFTVPFYLNLGSIMGLAAALISIWICLFTIGIIQFYPAVYYRLGMKPVKCLKKCAIIFFDNTGFCFFTLAINIILSIFIFSLPGFFLSYLDQALRLRLLKYDWLDARAAEQETGQKRIKIPWNELLAEEREKTGERGLKSLIFPWKD